MPFLKFFILELESCREGFSSDAADSKMKNDPKFFFYIDKLEIRFWKKVRSARVLDKGENRDRAGLGLSSKAQAYMS